MKVVIDIPEENYKSCKAIYKLPVKKEVADAYTYAIANGNAYTYPIATGTPLPKGHGRLIDADALMELCHNLKEHTVDCNDIARFPTIIEADKEARNETAKGD